MLQEDYKPKSIFPLQMAMLFASALISGAASIFLIPQAKLKNFISQQVHGTPYYEHWVQALSPEAREKAIQLDQQYSQLYKELEAGGGTDSQKKQQLSEIHQTYSKILASERFELKTKMPIEAERLDDTIQYHEDRGTELLIKEDATPVEELILKYRRYNGRPFI